MKEKTCLDQVIGVEEASKLWGLSAGTIKNYCADGKIKAKKISNRWVILKEQTIRKEDI